MIYRRSHRIAVDRSKFLGSEGPSSWNLGGYQEIAWLGPGAFGGEADQDQSFESESKIEDPTQPDLAVA